jgi:hypothetical protein
MDMRSVVILPVIFGSLLVVSQQPNPEASLGAHNAQNLTVRGCIRGDKRYTFTQEATGATFRLQGKESLVASHRGKFVELLVKELQPNSGNSRAALPALQVEQLKQIAAECPATENTPTSKRDSGPSGPARDPAASRPISPGASTNPNASGDSGAPSAGTGNTPPQQ